MNNMPQIRSAGACLLILGMLLGQPLSAHSEDRPNILFLLADDYSFEVLHALGHKEIQTPNLDRLVASGTTFTHACNMGGYHGAICVASRTMLLTGRSLWKAKDLDQQMKAGKEIGPLWPELLKSAGYDTYLTGKWHVSTNPKKRFDRAEHVRPGMPPSVPEAYHRPAAGQPDTWSPTDPKFQGYWKGGKHWSEVTADDAVHFLQQARNSSHPFFMYVAFNAPHDPRQSPQSFLDRYSLSNLSVPKNFLPEYPWKDKIGCHATQRDESLAPFPRTGDAIKVHRREYYALITHLDAQIGRILEALEKSGMAGKTYVFFTADHGLAIGHHGLMGKQNLFEHSVRAPFLARGLKFPAGRRIDTRIYLQDVMPTVLELAGVEVPSWVQFKSLLPLVDDVTAPHYRAIYGAYMNLQRSVVQDHYKLLVYPEVPKTFLFDLNADPEEMNDLSHQPGQQNRIQSLFATLQTLQQETEDPLPLDLNHDRH